MTRAFVADASVAVGWIHPAQATPETEAMLEAIGDGATLEVPALWPLEVANALVVLVRRRKLRNEERVAGLGWLKGLRVRVDHDMVSLAFSRLSDLQPPTTCRSTTRPTWNSRSDAALPWAVRTVLSRRPPRALGSASGSRICRGRRKSPGWGDDVPSGR